MRKYILLLLVLFVTSCVATLLHGQPGKKEIVLVAIAHYIPDSLSCNWKPAYEKLLRYQPGQIMVEELMPEDSASNVVAFGAGFRAHWDSLIVRWAGAKANVGDSIKKYQALLRKENDPANRLQLFKYYYLGLDFGNRNFLIYQIVKEKERHLSYLDTTGTWDRFVWNASKSLESQKKNSEFFNLVYPLAEALKIDYLDPTDYRVTYPLQSAAYGRLADELAGTEWMKRSDESWKKYIAEEAHLMAACNLIAGINTKEWIDKTDFLQAHLLDGAKSKNVAEYTEVWYRRNRNIAEHIAQAADRSTAQKSVAFYGNMHVYPVKKFLEEKGYRVKLLGDLP